jgi:hypothetical protein
LTLTCQGFLIDKIEGLAAREVGFFSWSRASIVQPVKRKSIYGDAAETAKALCHALIAGRLADGQKADERHVAILSLPSYFPTANAQFKMLGWEWFSTQRLYYYRWEGWRLTNRDFWLGDRQLDDYFTDMIPDGASELDYKEVYSCFDRTSKGRRFITTEKGLIGWGPDNMYGSDDDQTKKGDLVAIIFGCSTPLVIRPHGRYFQVVGDAYLQGLMDGEALKSLETEGFHVQDFTFC